MALSSECETGRRQLGFDVDGWVVRMIDLHKTDDCVALTSTGK